MVTRTGDKVINLELFLVVMKLIRGMMRHGAEMEALCLTIFSQHVILFMVKHILPHSIHSFIEYPV